MLLAPSKRCRTGKHYYTYIGDCLNVIDAHNGVLHSFYFTDIGNVKIISMYYMYYFTVHSMRIPQELAHKLITIILILIINI